MLQSAHHETFKEHAYKACFITLLSEEFLHKIKGNNFYCQLITGEQTTVHFLKL